MAPFFEQGRKARLNILHKWDIGAQRQQRTAANRRPPSWAFRPTPFLATSRAAGTWAPADMGCPTNAKQSMLVTTIPAALERWRSALYYQTRAEKRFEIKNGEPCQALGSASGIQHQWRPGTSDQEPCASWPSHYVVAGGAINSPALLKRSKDTPDPHGLIGTRTFLHPVSFSNGCLQRERVEGWSGRPPDHLLRPFPAHRPHSMAPLASRLKPPPCTRA